MKYIKIIAFLTILILALAGCRGPTSDTNDESNIKSPGSSDSPSGIEGCWQGTWESTKDGTSGNFQVEFEKSGSTLDGKVVITGSAVTRGGDISGTYAGNKINFGFVAGPGADVKYQGTVNGNKMSGTWSVAATSDQGNWEGTKGCGELDGLTGTALEIANSGAGTTGGSHGANGGTTGSPTGGNGDSYDLNSGVSCSQTGPNGVTNTFSFKGDTLRADTSFTVPGVVTYDLQYANDAHYKIIISGANCQAVQTTPSTTIEEWRRLTIDNWINVRSKLSPPYPVGTPVCEGRSLETALFEIPAGCQIITS